MFLLQHGVIGTGSIHDHDVSINIYQLDLCLWMPLFSGISFPTYYFFWRALKRWFVEGWFAGKICCQTPSPQEMCSCQIAVWHLLGLVKKRWVLSLHGLGSNEELVLRSNEQEEILSCHITRLLSGLISSPRFRRLTFIATSTVERQS